MERILLVTLSFVVVVALLLGLLLERCCSVHRFRRRPPPPLPTTAANTSSPTHQKPFCNNHREVSAAAGDQTPVCPKAAAFYAHGVLQSASTDFLLAPPTVKEMEFTREVHGNNSLHHIGLLSPAASVASKEGGVAGDGTEHFVYISNPMYGDISREWGRGEDDYAGGGEDTPFKTPETSPSRMEEEEDTDDDGDYSPPLTFMKKLPAFRPTSGFSSTAWLAEGRPSIAASTSVTDTNKRSSSSSNSLCFSSPSW